MSANPFLVLSLCLFFIGLFGVLVRKNLLIILMSVELMLNGANLAFVAFGRELENMAGQMAVFFVITVAAAEAAVGLGLVIALFRNLKSVSTEEIQLLRE